MARFSEEQEDRWISLSDIMTGLMVIFMFIAIAYIIDTQEKRKVLEVTNQQIRVVQDSVQQILGQYRNNRDKIYQNMQQVLGPKLTEWGAEIDSTTLTVRFKGEAAQFKPGKDDVPSKFAKILNEFIPKFLELVIDTTYSSDIAEIKVSGHAYESGEPFMRILTGSQNRAKNVLKLIRDHSFFKTLPDSTQQALTFKLITTGMGYGRMLDDNMKYIIDSGNDPCAACSRRVEFTILTASERIINEVDKVSSND